MTICTIPVLDTPALNHAYVALKLLRYLRIDDTRRLIDWRRLDGGAHRLAVTDLSEYLLTAPLDDGGGMHLELARQYEETVRASLACAAAIDGLLSDLPDWVNDLERAEAALLTAAETVNASAFSGFLSLCAPLKSALAECTRLQDMAENAVGILPLRQRMETLDATAASLRGHIDGLFLTNMGAVAARLRALACDRLTFDPDETGPEYRQLASALADLERLAIPRPGLRPPDLRPRRNRAGIPATGLGAGRPGAPRHPAR